MRSWDAVNRSYHGVIDEHGTGRLFVERARFGPTERVIAESDGTLVLGELRPFDAEYGTGFGWGYNGGGTSRAAAAILSDALNKDPEAYSFPDKEGSYTGALREDFCMSVLAEMCDEWRMHHSLVLYWVRGWYAEQGVTDLPEALQVTPLHGREMF